MRSLVVATDFSARSHRALRRAVLLAQTTGATMTLLHVVDDDQPAQLVEITRAASAELLDEQARALREADGVACTPEIALGEPFEAIAATAARTGAGLVVIGQHRREILRDMFVGTTAERTIRATALPVLMVQSAPAGPYRGILAATDLSDSAARALAAAGDLGLAAGAVVAALYIYASGSALARAGLTDEAVRAAERQEAVQAAAELDRFLAGHPLAPADRTVRPDHAGIAGEICATATRLGADLLVLGTRRHWGLTSLLLGSVSGEVLRLAPCDVLAVPPPREALSPPP